MAYQIIRYHSGLFFVAPGVGLRFTRTGRPELVGALQNLAVPTPANTILAGCLHYGETPVSPTPFPRFESDQNYENTPRISCRIFMAQQLGSVPPPKEIM